MIRVILIDDEILAISLLENLLNQMNAVHIVGKFTDGEEAVMAVNELKPDLIFLDIEMQGKNGIQIAESLKTQEQLDIVFVTAYDQYALEAFQVHAVDYLLKPIDQKRLEETVLRISSRKQGHSKAQKKKPFKAQFLGHFILYNKDGHSIKWRTKKVKELCAYLLHQNKAMHKDQIMDALWPDSSFEKAKGLLHTSMYQLRKELKNQGFEEVIEFVDERYRLHLDYESDFKRMTQLEQERNEHYIQQLLDIYKGDYLAEDDYEWSASLRYEIRANYIKRMTSIIDQEQSENHMKEKVLLKLIELDPYEEQFRQMLLQWYIEQNQTEEANHHYKQYEEYIWSELKEKPQEITRKLIRPFQP
ncbi:putative response regulator [Bacillus sp. TS-2]|nr:putative response regulator [Bacillus sp. TS-2]